MSPTARQGQMRTPPKGIAVNDALLTIKSKQGLLDAVQRAASRTMSPEERLEQRVSFVFGSIDSTVTRDQVRDLLLEQEGTTTADHK
jgi:SpoU rRNA methylase family enzyme